jgi:hypothetical protein
MIKETNREDEIYQSSLQTIQMVMAQADAMGYKRGHREGRQAVYAALLKKRFGSDLDPRELKSALGRLSYPYLSIHPDAPETLEPAKALFVIRASPTFEELEDTFWAHRHWLSK